MHLREDGAAGERADQRRVFALVEAHQPLDAAAVHRIGEDGREAQSRDERLAPRKGRQGHGVRHGLVRQERAAASTADHFDEVNREAGQSQVAGKVDRVHRIQHGLRPPQEGLIVGGTAQDARGGQAGFHLGAKAGGTVEQFGDAASTHSQGGGLEGGGRSPQEGNTHHGSQGVAYEMNAGSIEIGSTTIVVECRQQAGEVQQVADRLRQVALGYYQVAEVDEMGTTGIHLAIGAGGTLGVDQVETKGSLPGAPSQRVVPGEEHAVAHVGTAVQGQIDGHRRDALGGEGIGHQQHVQPVARDAVHEEHHRPSSPGLDLAAGPIRNAHDHRNYLLAGRSGQGVHRSEVLDGAARVERKARLDRGVERGGVYDRRRIRGVCGSGQVIGDGQFPGINVRQSRRAQHPIAGGDRGGLVHRQGRGVVGVHRHVFAAAKARQCGAESGDDGGFLARDDSRDRIEHARGGRGRKGVRQDDVVGHDPLARGGGDVGVDRDLQREDAGAGVEQVGAGRDQVFARALEGGAIERREAIGEDPHVRGARLERLLQVHANRSPVGDFGRQAHAVVASRGQLGHHSVHRPAHRHAAGVQGDLEHAERVASDQGRGVDRGVEHDCQGRARRPTGHGGQGHLHGARVRIASVIDPRNVQGQVGAARVQEVGGQGHHARGRGINRARRRRGGGGGEVVAAGGQGQESERSEAVQTHGLVLRGWRESLGKRIGVLRESPEGDTDDCIEETPKALWSGH